MIRRMSTCGCDKLLKIKKVNKTMILSKEVKMTNEQTYENDYIKLTHNWMDNTMTIYAQNRLRD